jgi:tRNA dimethylallyltransferase
LSSDVLILAGPTASGKTELAVELAREFDAEVVGADSRQIYRDMPIGTAAPSPAQLAEVPHHLVAFLDPRERYSAARYAADALDALADIRRRGKRAIVAGGTGFYIRALTGGVALAPQYDEALRGRLAREVQLHPPEFLHDWLARHDPARARALNANDTYRVIRALEIALAEPAAIVRENPVRTLGDAGFGWQLVFLDAPWRVVDARIARRTEEMLERGLVDEAARLGSEAVAATAVGYPQACAYLRGWSTHSELRASLERATRRYARRQRAWFRNEPATIWAEPAGVRTIVREKLRWFEKRA